MTENSQTELQLIEELRELEENFHKINIEINYIVTEPERRKLLAYEKKERLRYEQIKDSLQNLNDYSTSLNIHRNLIEAISQIKSSISSVADEYQISRHQYMIIDNYFISIIFEETNNIMNLLSEKTTIPLLKLTTDIEDSFNRNKLVEFLENELRQLKTISKINYITLLENHKNFKDRLIKLIL